MYFEHIACIHLLLTVAPGTALAGIAMSLIANLLGFLPNKHVFFLFLLLRKSSAVMQCSALFLRQSCGDHLIRTM